MSDTDHSTYLLVPPFEFPAFYKSSLKTAFSLNDEQTNSLNIFKALTEHIKAKLDKTDLSRRKEGSLCLKRPSDWNIYWAEALSGVKVKNAKGARYIQPESLGYDNVDKEKWKEIVSEKKREAENHEEWNKSMATHFSAFQRTSRRKSKKATDIPSSPEQSRRTRATSSAVPSTPEKSRRTPKRTFDEGPSSPERSRKTRASSSAVSSTPKKSRQPSFDERKEHSATSRISKSSPAAIDEEDETPFGIRRSQIFFAHLSWLFWRSTEKERVDAAASFLTDEGKAKESLGKEMTADFISRHVKAVDDGQRHLDGIHEGILAMRITQEMFESSPYLLREKFLEGKYKTSEEALAVWEQDFKARCEVDCTTCDGEGPETPSTPTRKRSKAGYEELHRLRISYRSHKHRRHSKAEEPLSPKNRPRCSQQAGSSSPEARRNSKSFPTLGDLFRSLSPQASRKATRTEEPTSPTRSRKSDKHTSSSHYYQSSSRSGETRPRRATKGTVDDKDA